MINVPLKELKENLSELAEKAAKGETIHVTKYNKPYLVISAAHSQGLIIGKNVGKFKPKAVINDKNLSKLLQKYLQEDRDSDDRIAPHLR